ncbi:L-aminoadipate-semialdehyde dehydrogenase-phosphopantetheinyl transferase isoform X1 [Lampetra fluviatilis]
MASCASHSPRPPSRRAAMPSPSQHAGTIKRVMCGVGGVRWAFRTAGWQPTRSEWLLATRCIQAEERQRVSEFVFVEDAKAAMAGRLLLRKAIVEMLGLPWERVRLGRTAQGKPVLLTSDPRPVLDSENVTEHGLDSVGALGFNVSHQGDFTVLAAELGHTIGVDIMKHQLRGRQTTEEFFRLMSRQFTPLEWRTIRSGGSDWEKLGLFYRHWCLKESYVKGVGVGLGLNLQRVEFRLGSPRVDVSAVTQDTRLFLDGAEDTGWLFQETMLDESHFVAVAVDRHSTVCQTSKGHRRGDESPCVRPFVALTFQDLMSTAAPLSLEEPEFWENFKAKNLKTFDT